AARLLGGGAANAPRDGVDPERIWELADAVDYDVQVVWPASGKPDRFDVTCRRAGSATGSAAGATEASAPAGAPAGSGAHRPWASYGNRSAADSPPADLIDGARSALEQAFPETMVPSAFVVLDRLPLSPNGKVDRRALPEPQGVRPELATEYVAPADALHEAVTGVWAEVLEIDRVGVRDDFFELGGHSLSATRIVARLSELFGVPLRLRDLFANPSPERLAERLTAVGREEGLDVAEVAEVLAEVDEMDEADVERLLAEEEGGA
ncbi:MAG TPA: phosphopantetheine-binding protein, partial [bacterium]|nr:phosphopantetheine-binding protein [bacterium]